MSRGKSPSARMRYRVTLQAPDVSEDEAGGTIRTWEDVAELWADIEPMNGRETFQAGQLAQRNAYRVTIRAREVTSAMRLVFGERVLTIHAVEGLPREKGLMELIAVETPEE